MIEWRHDMENAPRDGTDLLLWAGQPVVGNASTYLGYFRDEHCAIIEATAWASINAPEGEG